MTIPTQQFPSTNDPRQIEFYLRNLRDKVNAGDAIAWDSIDKTGSNLTDITTRNHNDLQSLNDGDFKHLTSLQFSGLTGGGSTTLHTHSHLNLFDIGTNTHAQIDSHIGASSDIHGVGAGSNVVGTNTIQNLTNKGLALENGGELTISGGVVSITGSVHTIDTEADAATDDLDTINGAFATDQIIVISAENAGRTVVVKNGTGNIDIGSDFSMTGLSKNMVLKYNGTNWVQFSRNDI